MIQLTNRSAYNHEIVSSKYDLYDLNKKKYDQYDNLVGDLLIDTHSIP